MSDPADSTTEQRIQDLLQTKGIRPEVTVRALRDFFATVHAERLLDLKPQPKTYRFYSVPRGRRPSK